MVLCGSQTVQADLPEMARAAAEPVHCDDSSSPASRSLLETVLYCFFFFKTNCACIPRYSKPTWVNHILCWEVCGRFSCSMPCFPSLAGF